MWGRGEGGGGKRGGGGVRHRQKKGNPASGGAKDAIERERDP